MRSEQPNCIGSQKFSPDAYFDGWHDGNNQSPSAKDNDLRTSIRQSFNLLPTDTYVYHAIASVTLDQVQQAIAAGGQHGLHAWYLDGVGEQTQPPSTGDIDAYTSIFSSTTSTDKSLKAFASNAKKGSLRARIAENLLVKRIFPAHIVVPKRKQPHANPYLDYWTWSCRCLEWAGPEEAITNVRQSHHILPVFYHHFGCVVPTFEALEAIRQLAAGRPIIDAGSGNGYWTYMLRRTGLQVTPVDNGDSVWRTMWVGDTIKADAAKVISKQRAGANDAVLLMVYPQVTTGFARETLDAYKGDMVCIAGTQNDNNFTADVGALMRARGDQWEKILQTPLPSFAGKDEAFSVFKKPARCTKPH